MQKTISVVIVLLVVAVIIGCVADSQEANSEDVVISELEEIDDLGEDFEDIGLEELDELINDLDQA